MAAASLVAIAAAALNAADPPRIPLRQGLVVVTAVADARGDYESLKRIGQVDDRTVRIFYRADLPDTGNDALARLLGVDCESGGSSGRTRNTSASGIRDVRRQDLETAREYRYTVHTCSAPELFPGSTALGLSTTVLRELRAKGKSRIAIVGAPDQAAAPGASNAGGEGAAGIEGLLNAIAGPGAAAIKVGDLQRVEPADVPFRTIVNNQPVDLPAVHARARLGDIDTEFWILDDESNPLALKWLIGNQRLQVIKLSFPLEAPASRAADNSRSPAPPNAIEQQLATACRAVLYGIYFDFAQDRITPESDPVLSDIAAALQHNAGWTLTVEGHTDNIGGDAYNLDLSKRRAAAVRQELVSRHHIAADRLQTSGYGASRPKDSNSTVEGRARNRRVELTRACGARAGDEAAQSGSPTRMNPAQ